MIKLRDCKSRRTNITGVGVIACGRPYINGQGRATTPTYTTPSFGIYNPKAILIRILKS
ncbi:hypothetical protein [uncultured Dysgonomonas sp.]|uniref:hypothetical protein n=1 Tax=uncultured Dysgonomonas sp. TaxID=206096 RepID=UPI0028057188|nr:hypothetical protein [uncultured Dysgonomonas sp.]